MPRFRCRTCFGDYADQDRDGHRYFHACAPIPNPNYQPDSARVGYDPREYIERPGHRDERPVDIVREIRTGQPRPPAAPIRNEGRGRDELAGP